MTPPKLAANGPEVMTVNTPPTEVPVDRQGKTTIAPDVLLTMATVVLQRGKEARPKHLDAHRIALKRSYSTSSIDRKRTRSPAWSRLGSSRAVSNMARGVRPMMFQPPGIVYG